MARVNFLNQAAARRPRRARALPVICGALAALTLCAGLLFSLRDGARTYRFALASDEGGAIPIGIARVLNGDYEPGAKIRLTASTDEGYRFANWSSSGGGEFDDPGDSGATFTMPDADVTVTAHFAKG